MTKILAACELKSYDRWTDIREQGLTCGADLIEWLNGRLGEPTARIERRLRGWPPYNATFFVGGSVYHVLVSPADPQPAIITIAALFVTCPACSHDIPVADNTEYDTTTDWDFGNLAEFTEKTDPEELLKCPDCDQRVTITLPKSLPVCP